MLQAFPLYGDTVSACPQQCVFTPPNLSKALPVRSIIIRVEQHFVECLSFCVPHLFSFNLSPDLCQPCIQALHLSFPLSCRTLRFNVYTASIHPTGLRIGTRVVHDDYIVMQPGLGGLWRQNGMCWNCYGYLRRDDGFVIIRRVFCGTELNVT